ncbi:hypothetical protein V8J36_12460 [Frigidibacter sp. MR17.14]|uniref:hypothetical protein n=1 Tax=Frigidibacter sp. MR17.14 TaxID=3126509 RepID=UPI003013106C
MTEHRDADGRETVGRDAMERDGAGVPVAARDLEMVETLLGDWAAARRVEPGTDFLSRVLGEALDEQLSLRAAAASSTVATQAGGLRGFLARLRDGWQVAGGLATAGLAGLWIGFAAPGLASGLTSGLAAGLGGDESADETLTLIPSYEVAASFLDQIEGLPGQ